MNYFEHHIGDYAEATAHLTFVEDAAYHRLIRKYYAQEKPLPADLKQVQRMVGARTKEEKNAVVTVLEEFFSLQDDGWHQERCDRQIAEYRAGEPEREAKKSNEETRVKRHREERARLFSLLNQAGMHAPWNTSITELRAMVERNGLEPATKTPLPATPPATPPVTAPATPATATQTPIPNTQSPIPNTQYPELKPKADDDATDSGRAGDCFAPPTETPLPEREEPEQDENQPAIALTVKLRKWGVNATFTHPAVQDWAKREVPHDILAAAVAQAREVKGDAKLPPNYLVPIVEKLLNPPAKTEPAPPRQPSDDWFRSKAGIERKGRELGMFPRGTESHDDFKDRIFAHLRKGATPL